MKKIILFVVFFVLLLEVLAQDSIANKSWGLIVGPHATGHKFQRGVGVSYPHNTSYSFANDIQYGIQFYQQRMLTKNIRLETSIAFSRYSGKTIYSYDSIYPLSSKTLSDERKVSYIGIGPKIQYKVRIRKISASPYAGFSFDLLLSSITHQIHSANGQTYLKSISLKEHEKPFNASYDLGIQIAYELKSNIGLEIRPFYEQLLRPNTMSDTSSGKVFYAYGIAFGITIKR